MGFSENIERKGITSVSIHPNGNVILKKSCNRNKIFISTFTVITLLITVLFVYYFYREKNYEICTTKLCLESSVSLMNCMNETVNPCEDFYEFACGMFETNYPSYNDADDNSWIKILSLKVKQKVKKFLTQEDEKYEPEVVHKIRKFYYACLNFMKDPIDNNYDSLRNIWNKVGLNTDYLSDSAPLEIETILARIKIHFDIDVFFSIDVDDDPRNSSSYSLLFIYQNDNFEDKQRNVENPNKDTIEEAVPRFTEYFKLVVDKLLDYNQTHVKQLYAEDLMNIHEELVDFKSNISKISKNTYSFNSNVPIIFTLEKLQNLTDSNANNFKFNWTLYIRELLHDIKPEVYEQLTLENSNTYEILISNPNYIENVFKLFSETPTTLIKMYLLTQIVTTLETYFPREEHFNSEYCLSTTTDCFGMVTGYSMINTLDDPTKVELVEMFNNIKLSLRKMIHESTWMDDETKKATLRKLDYTKTYFGFPNNYTNLLNNLYHDLNVTENHLENMLLVSINSKSHWKYLTTEKDRENMKWEVLPDEVNAFSYNAMNALFIPAAILQSPLYHKGIQSLNYGIMGSTMGHELSHNYDNTGRLYNELGNVVPWWTEKSQEEYKKRADCLVRYYSEIDVASDKLRNHTFVVDGNLTLDENIADIVGLKEAYYAYQIYVDAHGKEPRLPGLEMYNPEQLFFLGYANQYCYYDTVDNSFDVHSPNKVRVQGVLSLLPEFAKAWSCEIGTRMNPKTDEKCQIW